MKRIRAILLVTVALAALSAVASNSASAACTAKINAGCIEVLGVLVVAIQFSVSKKPGTSIVLTVVGIGEVECETAEGSGELIGSEAAGISTSSYKLKFNGKCKLIGHAGCMVSQPIETVGITGTVESITSGTAAIGFKPTSGTEFAKVTISECEQEAIIKVTGTQKCKGIAVETEAETHEIDCEGSESSLKDGTKEAKFLFHHFWSWLKKHVKFRLGFF